MYLIYKILNSKRKRNPLLYIKKYLLKIYTKISHKEMSRFINMFNRREFVNAIEIGNNIIYKGKGNNNFLKKYAIGCFYSGNAEKAREIMSKVLLAETSCDLETVIEYSSMIDGDFVVSNSEYEYLGGYFNYGFVKNHLEKHDDVHRCIVSKIVSSKDEGMNCEVYFYENICKRYPKLMSFVPEFYGCQKIADSKITLIRTEYIQSGRSNDENIDEIIKINGIIESIPYEEAKAIFSDTRFKRDKYIQQLLHQRITNREAISEMKFLLNKIEDGEKIRNLVCKFEKIIFEKQLYKKIKPRVHYSFCHNDFHRPNIITVKDSKRCFVIDWNSCCVAMRGWDMNYYFGDFEFEFDEIKARYIDKITFDDEVDEKIAKFYFVLMQIFLWIKRLEGERCCDKFESYFAPAFNFMEKITKTL